MVRISRCCERARDVDEFFIFSRRQITRCRENRCAAIAKSSSFVAKSTQAAPESFRCFLCVNCAGMFGHEIRCDQQWFPAAQAQAVNVAVYSAAQFA